MRNIDEMLEETRQKLGALSEDEIKKQKVAKQHYRDARDAREKVLQFQRSRSYLEQEGMPSNLVEAYGKLAEAFEEVANQHIYAADHIAMRLVQNNKSVTIFTEE